MLEKRIAELNQRLTGGVTPAMATPIDPATGRVELAVVPQLVEFLVDRGVKGLFVGGTTGEGIMLPTDERMLLHEAALKAANGRVPILVHAGAVQTEAAIELARHAALIGADAIAAVTPIFYGIHDDALAVYYHAIADAAPETPLLAYDIPHMAVNGISPRLARRLLAEIPSFAGLKSSQRDLQAIYPLIDAVPDARLLLVGNETIALGSLAMGADGMISGLATAVPEPLVAMTEAFFRGDLQEARHWQRLANRLLAVLPAGARIGTMKAILVARGIPVGPPVAPLPAVSEDLWGALQEILAA